MRKKITEIVNIEDINVYSKSIGTKRHKKDVMIIIDTEEKSFDLFLTKEQANKLCEEILKTQKKS